MNPPGFPGESVEQTQERAGLRPGEAAKQLMADAGFADGVGFPKLTIYREAFPALTNAAEAIAAMLKENLGVESEVQDLDYATFTEKIRGQKKNQSGDMSIALVPYEFDFVDGSNLLSVWGGCEEEGADMSAMPGRHTWFNQEYNQLLCDAGSLLGDKHASRCISKPSEFCLRMPRLCRSITQEFLRTMVKPYLKGPMFDPSDAGLKTWNRFRFSSRESMIYKRQ